MQKFIFKRHPTARAFGLLEPHTIGDGERTLLCGGFWGAARHCAAKYGALWDGYRARVRWRIIPGIC